MGRKNKEPDVQIGENFKEYMIGFGLAIAFIIFLYIKYKGIE